MLHTKYICFEKKKLFVESDMSTKITHTNREKIFFLIMCHVLIKETEKEGEKYIKVIWISNHRTISSPSHKYVLKHTQLDSLKHID